MIPETDLAYASGFFDGEGTVSCYFGSGPNRTAMHYAVSVNQKSPDVLHWFKSAWGGSISTHAKRTTGSWYLTGNNAFDFLYAIRPYSRGKALDIDCMLDIWSHRLDAQGKVRKEFVSARFKLMQTVRQQIKLESEEIWR